jgi:hypothetical protein
LPHRHLPRLTCHDLNFGNIHQVRSNCHRWLADSSPLAQRKLALLALPLVLFRQASMVPLLEMELLRLALASVSTSA